MPFDRSSQTLAHDGRDGPATVLTSEPGRGAASDLLAKAADASPPLGALITPVGTSAAPLQRKESPAPAGDDPFGVHLGGGGAPLEPGARARLEDSYGVGLGHVRVHDDAGAHARAAGLGARAFADGADVYFGAGQREAGGFALLAHEVAHTVASGGARGDATGRHDDAAEHDADRAAQAAAGGARAQIVPAAPALRLSPLPAVLHQPVARIRIHSAFADAVEGMLTAESELVPSGETSGAFAGYATRGEAELRARSAVDPDADRPEIHVTVIVREAGPEPDRRYHVFDTGRQPLRTSGDDPPNWSVSPISRQGMWDTVEVVRFTREESATATGAAGMPVLAAQEGPTCGAASLVAYVVATDAERGGVEHTVFTTAVSNVIAHARAHRGSIQRRLARFSSHGTPAEIFDGSMSYLAQARDLATAGDIIGATPILTRYLYILYQGMASAGMTDGETGEASAALGIQGAGNNDDRPRDANVEDFDGLFTNAVVRSLHPGEAAQVSWLAGSGQRWTPHYFLIGVRPNRQAYFYDQATPYQQSAPDIETLRHTIRGQVGLGELHYWPPGPRPEGIFSSSAHRLAPDRI